MKHYCPIFFIITLLILGLLSCKSNNSTGKNSDTSDTSAVAEYSETIEYSKKPEGITYKVSDVKAANSKITLYSAQQVFEAKVGKNIRFIPDELKDMQAAPCPNNGLIDIVQECYDNHRPLILTPDVIWLTICQGVSIHVNESYDSLKNILFVKDKPSHLKVRNDSLEYGAKHWKDLIASFSQLTKQYTKQDYYSFFVSEFSTTTEVHKTAYEITLLESYKKGFVYVGDTGCGIPYITLTGTKEDWQAILSKLNQLEKFGLSAWGESLKPIIQQFVNVFDSKVDEAFWQSLYKDASEYAAFYISGWIIKFFPYIKISDDYNSGEFTEQGYKLGKKFTPNPFIEGNKHLLSTLSTDNFPSGLSQIEIIWNSYFKDETSTIEIYAGIMGIKQYDDNTLEPIVAWVACDKNAKPVNHVFPSREKLSDEKPSTYWSPHIAEKLTDSAIYNHRKFESQHESLSYVKNIIQDSLSNKTEFINLTWNNSSIDFTVLSNGEVVDIQVNEVNDKLAEAYIKQLVYNLPEKWLPALTHLPNALDISDMTDEEEQLKIKVNSNVHFTLLENKRSTSE